MFGTTVVANLAAVYIEGLNSARAAVVAVCRAVSMEEQRAVILERN